MSKQLAYQLIIFDWDGTLVDSQALIVNCMRLAAEEAEVPVPDEEVVRSCIGLSLEQSIKQIFPDVSRRAHGIMMETYRRHYFTKAEKYITLFPHVDKTLQSLLDEGYWLAVATGKGRRGLDKDILNTGLSGFFSTTRTVDECSSKPDPQMLIEILDELGLTEKNAVMIGDSEHDLNMAENAGMDAVGISTGAREKSYLQSLHCRTCIDDISELPAWLESVST